MFFIRDVFDFFTPPARISVVSVIGHISAHFPAHAVFATFCDCVSGTAIDVGNDRVITFEFTPGISDDVISVIVCGE